MADRLTAVIPLAEVRRVQLYINRRRKSLAAIRRETGADYLLNGTLYGFASWKPVCHLKADGAELYRPDYTVYGYAWDTGPDLRMEVLPSKAANYIACTPLIVGGKKLQKLTYDPGQGGSRGRSAMGLMGGRLALYCARDGSRAARTPEGLRDELFAAGWDSAVMLDGGGSSQCDFNGQKIVSARTVQNLILVYLKKEDALEPRGGKPMVEINAYSKAKDGGKKLSAHFKVSEFACKDGSDAVLVAPRLVMVLQSLRSRFGKAVVINSGYRTPQYNAKVGGAAQSQHTYGTAADISVAGVSPKQVAACARELMPDWGGVGTYKTFVHVDIREERADWDG